jgi:hypothetical protein
MVGVILMVQYFPDCGIGIFPGMIAERTVMADFGPNFPKHRNFLLAQVNFFLHFLFLLGFHFPSDNFTIRQ